MRGLTRHQVKQARRLAAAIAWREQMARWAAWRRDKQRTAWKRMRGEAAGAAEGQVDP